MWVEQKGTVWRATLPPSSHSQPSFGAITTAGRMTPLPISGRTPTPTTGRTDARSPTPVAPPPSTLLFNSALHSSSQSLTQWRTALLNLRGQMLAVVRHLLAFVLYSVLEVHWRMLEKKLSTAERGSRGGDKEKEKASATESDEHANAELNRDHIETVDQLLRDHVDFLDTCLKECMLSSSRLVKVCFLPSVFRQFLGSKKKGYLATPSATPNMHCFYLVYWYLHQVTHTRSCCIGDIADSNGSSIRTCR